MAPGLLISLLGPSGCGKTTLLRVITGTLLPDFGRVMLNGEDVSRVPTHRRNMGMVFQSFALLPHLSVAENIAFPLGIRGIGRDEQRQRVAEALRMVHLEAYAARRPRELSGGQQQRVGLARAIVYRPSVLLLDEPLSNLDASLREEMRIEISQVTRQLGITSIYVTHDQREALALSDAIAVMNHGRVVQFGTPEDIYRRPANAFIAGFVGYANAVPIAVAGRCGTIDGGGGLLRLPAATGLSARMTAFIHASDIELAKAANGGADGEATGENRLSCRVVESAFMGDHMEYILAHANGMQLKGHAPVGEMVFARGTTVFAVLPPDKLVLVPRDD